MSIVEPENGGLSMKQKPEWTSLQICAFVLGEGYSVHPNSPKDPLLDSLGCSALVDCASYTICLPGTRKVGRFSFPWWEKPLAVLWVRDHLACQPFHWYMEVGPGVVWPFTEFGWALQEHFGVRVLISTVPMEDIATPPTMADWAERYGQSR